MFRVQKLLSAYGYCSRRKAEDLIKEGRVKVNDKIIQIGDKATDEDEIKVDNKLINKTEKRYLIFNKPMHCVTALEDEFHKTIMHYVKVKERVFPIGRLDYNTTGLLLLTNDGDFANKVMHPRYEVKKTYLVEADKEIYKNDIKSIEEGVMLEDGKTAPAKVKVINGTTIEITIHEGKNRIIRRIMEALGYKTRKIERIMIGKLTLGDLKPGQYKDIGKKDRDKIFI